MKPGCIWGMAGVVVLAGAGFIAWAANNVTITLRGFAAIAGGGVVLLLLLIWWSDRKHAEEVQAAEESWHKWDAWNAARPDPEDPKYSRCWNEGGGRRFVRDRNKYDREYPEPETITRKPTIRR